MTTMTTARDSLRRRIGRAKISADLQRRSVVTLLLMGEVEAATRMAQQAEATDRRIEALLVELRTLI